MIELMAVRLFIINERVIALNNSHIVLRVMKLDDLNGAIQLWRQTKGVIIRDYDDSPEGIARFIHRNPKTTLVLEQDGEIVGTLLCGNDGRRGFLYHFVVREDLRNHGLGSMMLNEVYRQLREDGIAKGGLVALQSNESGFRFWQNRGWSKRNDLFYLDFPLCPEAE